MRIWLVNICLLLSALSFGQNNLVPNYSFEEKDSCPSIVYELTPTCKLWFDPISKMNPLPTISYNVYDWGIGSYFNKCNTQGLGIPNNLAGIQSSRTGDAYAGINIIVHMKNQMNYNRFLNYAEIRLLKKLKKDYTYKAEFYYSHAELYSNPDPDYFIKTLFLVELGMLFTDSIMVRDQGIATDQPQNIYTNPQVKAMMGPSIDTVNWIKVSGTFKAIGGEQYLTIGSFKEIDTISQDAYTFIFIDDVSVVAIDSVIPDTSSEIEVYPVPSERLLWLDRGDSSLINLTFQLYNSLGQLVLTKKFEEDLPKQSLDLLQLQAGVYFYSILEKQIVIKKGKIIRI